MLGTLVWTCRDLMIIFADSRDLNWVPKTPLKNPVFGSSMSFGDAMCLVGHTCNCGNLLWPVGNCVTSSQFV